GGEDEVLHARPHGAFDQRARPDGVVLIVAERVGDGFGNDDRAGEVDDGVDIMCADRVLHEGLVADVADDELCGIRHRPVETGAEAVDDHHLFAAVEQLPHHVAAYIAGAAGDKNGHSVPLTAASTQSYVQCSTRENTKCAPLRGIDNFPSVGEEGRI